MPQNTSRGYPYPLYADTPKDFPASIQALATAIDTDVAALEAFIAGPCGDAYRSNRRLVDMGMVPGELRDGTIAAFGSPTR